MLANPMMWLSSTLQCGPSILSIRPLIAGFGRLESPCEGRTNMSCQRERHYRDVLVAVGALLLVQFGTHVTAGDPAVLVRLLVRGDQSVTTEAGVLMADEPDSLRILDLTTGQERTFKRAAIRSLTNPATEQEVATVTGIAPLVSWFIAEALPSRPKAGQVASVDGAVAYINRGSTAGVQEGERFDVFRGAGQDIVDPESGEVLGSAQKRIAQVEILEVREKLSKVRVTTDFEVELEVGDVVRPVAAEQAIAVLPLGRDSGQLIQGGIQLAEQITSCLAKNGVTVVERTVLDKVLGELALSGSAAFDPDTAKQVGKLALAHAVVTGTIQFNTQDANVNVRLIEVETGKILYGTSLRVKGLNATPLRTRTGGASRPQPVVPSPATGAAHSTLQELDEVGVFNGHTNDLRWIEFSPDGRMLASAAEDGTVCLWNVQTRERVHRIVTPGEKELMAGRFTPDGRLLITCAYGEPGARVWDVQTGRATGRIDEREFVRGIGFDAVNHLVFTGGGTGLRVHNLRDFHQSSRLPMESTVGRVWFAQALSYAGLVATSHIDGDIRLWDWRQGKLVQTLRGHAGIVSTLDLSPSGRMLASAGEDTTVQVWDLPAGNPRWQYTGHSAFVMRARFSPNGKYLVTSSFDGTLRILDASSGQELLQHPTHCSRWVDWSPDGTLLASCKGKGLVEDYGELNEDYSVRIWAVPTLD